VGGDMKDDQDEIFPVDGQEAVNRPLRNIYDFVSRYISSYFLVGKANLLRVFLL
jgi:hypothetical protein